jgi:hypothetical protein
MKKFNAFLLLAWALLFLQGCGSSNSNKQTAPSNLNLEEINNSNPSTDVSTDTNINFDDIDSTDITVDEEVIADNSTDQMNSDTDLYRTFIGDLYTTVLQRPMDPAGFRFYRDILENSSAGEIVINCQNIIASFFTSSEYGMGQVSNRSFVQTLYLAFYDREVDNDGFQFWHQHLNAGNIAKADLLNIVKNNQETVSRCQVSLGVSSIPPQPQAGSQCMLVWAPVCGVDGRTYDNACFARQAGTPVASNGRCSQTSSVFSRPLPRTR